MTFQTPLKSLKLQTALTEPTTNGKADVEEDEDIELPDAPDDEAPQITEAPTESADIAEAALTLEDQSLGVDLLNSPDASSFYSTRISLYLPIPAITLPHHATSALLSRHIAPLLLTYFPPVKGTVLAFQDPVLSANASAGVNHALKPPTDDQFHAAEDDASYVNQVLAQASDQQGVAWVWLTVTFLVFNPQRGDQLYGVNNVASEGFVGLVSYNYFQISVGAKRIPGHWKWRGPETTQGRKQTRRSKGKMDQDGRWSQSSPVPDPSQSSVADERSRAELESETGFYLESGDKVDNVLKFTVVDTDMVAGSHKGEWALHVDGTLLDEAAEKAEYKLKNLPSLHGLEELGKVEAEVEGIEGGKVLVVKVQGEVHALNANCTHYGAPLKNGVVTSDGRITCPWHGACFSSKTGDVEDAPAPYALNKFDLVEKDGGVGSAAFGALLRLRELEYAGKTTVLTTEGLPIDRTKLSKALVTDASKLYLQPQAWYDDGAVDIRRETTVTSVDFQAKVVKTASGESFAYTKLILASGGTPKRLPLPGFKDLGNIFVVRQVSDIQAIVAAVGEEKRKHIVIIGTSFIGMEAANALAKDNTVSLVGLEEVPLERVLGRQIGQIFQRSLEKTGAKFYLGASVDSAVPASASAGAGVVGAIKLKDGTELKADLVILGVGVNPATEYLRGNRDIKLEKDGSLSVDASFAVKGLSDVYAIGDIATYPYSGPGGNNTPVRIEHWNVAQNAGRSVGQQIAQPGAAPEPSFIPIFWSALGSQLRYAGATTRGYDDVVVKGDPGNGKFVAYYTKGDGVVAVASMGMDPVVVQAAELLRKGNMPTKAELEHGQDPLKSLL
ncbi:hypothetical protein DV735_g4828, partial [Chaetothyriales sp. CBS 134920]